MRHVGTTEWDTESVLPVSFAPLISCREDTKQMLQAIEIGNYLCQKYKSMILSVFTMSKLKSCCLLNF